MRLYRFNLSAEFNQFYLQDEDADWELMDSLWTQEEGQDQLALAPGLIAVGTNCDRIVPVEVQITITAPADDSNDWDQVIECSIDIDCGQLLVYGCCDFDSASRIQIKPGSYRARICYENQYSCVGKLINAETTTRLYYGQAKTTAIARSKDVLMCSVRMFPKMVAG